MLTTPARGPGYNLPQGALLTVGGPLPAALAPPVELFDDGRPILPNRPEFEAHVAAEIRRQTPPVKPRRLTRAEVISEVLDGNADAFNSAGRLGFPESIALRVGERVVEPVWHERYVCEWAARVAATAVALSR